MTLKIMFNFSSHDWERFVRYLVYRVYTVAYITQRFYISDTVIRYECHACVELSTEYCLLQLSG